MQRKLTSNRAEPKVQSLAEFFTHWSEPLFQYGCTLTPDRGQVEDAIQDLFVDLWRRQVEVASLKAPRTYLLTALRRLLLRNLQRAERSVDPWISEHAWQALVAEEPVATFAEQEERALACREAIASLPRRQREVINLRYYQGLSYREIAAVMGIKTSSVGRFLDRAITSLRTYLPQRLQQTLVNSMLLIGWLGG